MLHPSAVLDAALFRDSHLCVVGAICRDVKTAPLPPGDYLLHDGETSIGGVRETIGGGGGNRAGGAGELGAGGGLFGLVGRAGAVRRRSSKPSWRAVWTLLRLPRALSQRATM